VRLVVYQGQLRNPVPIFNEKVLCGLGRSIVSTGRLDPSGVERALATLGRFRALVGAIGVSDIQAVATAAVRDALDGAEFLVKAEARLQAPIRLLSGPEEAGLSALGVLSGLPDADGVVGDLGGGSLELVPVGGGSVGTGATLPLGPLQLMGQTGGNVAAARNLIDEILSQQNWLSDLKGRVFYAVGGAWRTMARIHMAAINYPLHVLHAYSLEARDAVEIGRLIARQSRRSLERMSDITQKRAEVLPFSAAVLEHVVERTGVTRVVISAFGLREGVLFSRLSRAEQNRDPLIEACAEMATRSSRLMAHTDRLADWTAPLFPEETRQQMRLRQAACLLADIGWRTHPDHRGVHAMWEVLRAPFAGVDHPGRIFVAAALWHRYAGNDSPPLEPALLGLLPADDLSRAKSLGLALRLAHTLTGATPQTLESCSLRLESDEVRLAIPAYLADLSGEMVGKRLSSLAKSLDLSARVMIGGR
jgi:exopolyphosphatase/guanosine-5'-triphosphate,3'-diphosphate pyrophosphatase